MKKKLLSLVIVAAFASNAYASDVQEVALLPGIVASAQTQAVDVTPALNAIDMQLAFQQDAQPMQVAALSGQEMKATEGAWGWHPALRVAAAANTVWGTTSRSQRDRKISAGVGAAINIALCRNPLYCR